MRDPFGAAAMPQITYTVRVSSPSTVGHGAPNSVRSKEKNSAELARNQSDYSRAAVWGVSFPAGILKTLGTREDVRRPPALKRSAQAIASVTHRVPRLRSASPSSGECAFYRYKDADFDLFVKTLKIPRPQGAWPESVYSQWAGEHGWGLKPYASHDASNALVIDFLPVAHLTFEQTQNGTIQQMFVSTMSEIHHTAAPACPTLNSDALEILGWRLFAEKGHRLGNRHNMPLCDISQLRTRMSWLLGELEREPAKHVLCHFDTLRRNLYVYRDRLILIDWELARLADPQRDLSKFFGFYNIGPQDAMRVLSAYYRGPPTPQDSRRFALWLQIMSIDHLAWLYCSPKKNQWGIRIKAEHINKIASLLAHERDMPALHWNVAS